MDRDDIQALRESVDMLRTGHDHLEAVAGGRPRAMSARHRDELRRVAHHIDEHLGRGETVAGDGFVVVID